MQKPTNYNIIILGRAQADGARWVLDSYQDFGTLDKVEACARSRARIAKGVYAIHLNDLAQTEVRKNY